MGDVFEGLYPRITVSPLALSVILDAHLRRGQKVQHCLCTLLGTLLDDGALWIKDAIPNYVSPEDAGKLPQRQHHESFVLARQRLNPRELVLGWASTDLTFTQLHEIAAWARMDTKASRFVPQKRLPAPVAIRVTPPTARNDLKLEAAVRGPGPEYIKKTIGLLYAPFEDYICDQTQCDQTQCDQDEVLDMVARIDKQIQIATEAKRTKNEELGRRLLKLVSMNLPCSTQAYIEKEREEVSLHEWIKIVAEIQLRLSSKIHASHV
ncbi:JAB1/Mov34/MPN/PAD-1 ubiquitin protease [Gregarina niphandrodes]|uniref:JAB1/Mov34/MPN/PAD-1 ubiquitin protease n=1 Tax=Gregarina niphandrodes TaxID=110365 RepID=A0A023B188_GRENI|nr:JAB1/Mov34/MPN/PAD-1 ubiquitin protease [Gregarina niphandrodes]EZG45422.1 JAB1/Mov34/MPN/PAD-1 ubiquitin protease [Gregarina niphandrodes]|eukprot:XP_011132498.1 JAB1/Mov34/MPN/PAD-1 ubiquitin protease [Gregarina niphandrodes]